MFMEKHYLFSVVGCMYVEDSQELGLFPQTSRRFHISKHINFEPIYSDVNLPFPSSSVNFFCILAEILFDFGRFFVELGVKIDYFCGNICVKWGVKN